jgi:hypothetical protein
MTKMSEDIMGGDGLPLFLILNIEILLRGKVAYQFICLI